MLRLLLETIIIGAASFIAATITRVILMSLGLVDHDEEVANEKME